MELFFKKVLEKYMERRGQLYLLIGFILISGNMIFNALVLFLSKFAFKAKKIINARPNNITLIKFRLKEGNCEHLIKVDKNKNLNNYIKSFEKILEKCVNCRDNFIEIENILLNNTNLDKRAEIKFLNIDENSLLIIDDDS